MLFGRTYVTFESDYSIAESVERLSSMTRRPSFATIGPEAAVGLVGAQRVLLCRVIPYVQNSFKPFFTGAFEETDGRIRLRGSFATHGLVRAFACIWFGVLIALTLFLAWRGTQAESHAWKIALLCVGMMFLGVVLTALGRWFARNDVAWLSAVIQGALTRPRP